MARASRVFLIFGPLLFGWFALTVACHEPRPADRAPAVAGKAAPPADAAGDQAEAGAASQEQESRAYVGFGPRLEAAQDLARLGPDGAAALRAGISDERPAVRAVAALALLESPQADEDDLRRVGGLLAGDDWTVRVAAGLALLEAMDDERLREAAPPPERILSCLADAPEATDADAARAVCLLFAAGKPRTEARLLRAPPNLAAPVVRLLREMLADPDVRYDAMDLLGLCGACGAEAAADLDPARYEDPGDRREAAVALVRLGCRLDDALPVLAENLDRFWARHATLCTDDWRAVVPLLRRSLAGRGPIPPESALRIACALGRAAAECVPEILELRGSPDLAPLVACALAGIGPAAAPALPWLLAESGGSRLCDLREGDVPRAGPRVLEEYRCLGPIMDRGGFLDIEPDVCSLDALALHAAARIGPSDPDVVRAAMKRLDDPDPRVREAATLALSDALSVGEVALDPVRARFVRDPSGRVRAAAATVLGFAAWRGRAEAAAALARELEGGDAFGREYAARALAMAGEDAALAKALESEASLTRTWAAAALFDPQADRLPSRDEFEELHATMTREGFRRSRAAEVMEACARDGDPAVRLLAVHVIGKMPEHFRDTWEGTLASAEPDPDVGLVATVVLRYWDKHLLPWEKFPPPSPPPGRVEELATGMRGADLPTPVDVALGSSDKAALAAIAGDGGFLAFEQWFAGRALR